MTQFFKRFAQDESGATAIEYGLIAALISITIIAGATAIGNGVKSKFNTVATAVG
jgi:pilus assembly protein Flp/PilA